MKKRPFFIESKQPTFEGSMCDKCGERIVTVGEGKHYWNPNPNALDRNICQNCYEVWLAEKTERQARWKAKSMALKREQHEQEYGAD